MSVVAARSGDWRAEKDPLIGGGYLLAAAATQQADLPLGSRAADRPIASSWQPCDIPLAAASAAGRLNARLSGDDGEEMSHRETGSTDSPPVTHEANVRLNPGGTMATPGDVAPVAPLLYAVCRAPVPSLRVQHLSLDSGRQPLSSDDGEPLQLQTPPHQPSPPQPGPARPTPAEPEVPFEWVTRGVPPLPPKKTMLCAPRFEWVRAATPPMPPEPPVPSAPCPAVGHSPCPRATVGTWTARVQLDAAPQPECRAVGVLRAKCWHRRDMPPQPTPCHP